MTSRGGVLDALQKQTDFSRRKNIKNKILGMVLALSVLTAFMPIVTVAAAKTSGSCGKNLTWSLDNAGTLTISGAGDMDDFYQGSSPFYINRGVIKSVVVAEGVTSIGNAAFYNCHRLNSITIPDSITSIGSDAFLNAAYYNNTSNWENDSLYIGSNLICVNPSEALNAYTINDGTRVIADNAFADCSDLMRITIPSSIICIGDRAFRSSSRLTGVYISDLTAWCNIDFGLYGANPLTYAKELYLDNELVTDIVIPNSIKAINSNAFCHCESVENITIPNSVTSIGDSAFEFCTNLTSITSLDGVESIGDNAFTGSGLTHVTLPDSVKHLGDCAFNSCDNLESVTIGNGITSIGEAVFEFCPSLSAVEFGSNTTSIGVSAFSGCTGLTSIKIPNTVDEIGMRAFQNSGLTSVFIPNSVISIGDDVFSER